MDNANARIDDWRKPNVAALGINTSKKNMSQHTDGTRPG